LLAVHTQVGLAFSVFVHDGELGMKRIVSVPGTTERVNP
jgi:hypothetical protein